MLLQDIVSNEVDLTETECMEKLFMYLDELKVQDDTFMELLMEKVVDYMDITWEQPWYQTVKCLTRPLPLPSDEDLEPFRIDTICKEEGQQIEKNWQKLRKKYDLPDTLICYARWKNKDKSRNPLTKEEQVRTFLIANLAKGLKRNLYQVHQYVLTHYGAPNKGYYTETEEKIMKLCFQRCPKHAAKYLATALGREPRGIYKRLRKNVDGGEDEKIKKKKMRWTLVTATKLVKLLLKYTGKSIDELQNEKIDRTVWLKIQKKMDHHYVYIQDFWYKYLHNQLYLKYDVKLKTLRRKILKRLRSYPYKVWGDIRWKIISKDFPSGFTYIFLYRMISRLVIKIPNYRELPLETLIENCLQQNKNCKKDARLKTLKLNEDGVLAHVKYDVKMEFD